MIKNIKLFFENLRDEFRNELFFDQKRLIQEVQDIEKHAEFIRNNLEIDLNNFPEPNEDTNANDALSLMVQRNYGGYATELKHSIESLEDKIEHLHKMKQMEASKRPLKLSINSHLKSKLFVLLSESVQMIADKKKPLVQSSKKNTPPRPKKEATDGETDEVLRYYKELEKHQ